MTKDEALDLALEALDLANYKVADYCNGYTIEEVDDAITAIKQALAEPTVQEPVAIIEQLWAIIDDIDTYGDMAKSDDKLYRGMVERRQKDRWKTGITTDGYTLNVPRPPAANQQWVGLTDEEIDKHLSEDAQGDCEMHEFARAIEAKLKEKNT
jgi:hypothetical protein